MSSNTLEVDQVLWNDQTEIVDHLFPELEDKYPNINRWYEVRQKYANAAEASGVVTVRFMSHMWVGCPVGLTLIQLVSLFTS